MIETALYIIRHGRTEGPKGPEDTRYKGTIDVPLAAEGRAQAGKSGEALKLMLGTKAGGIVNVYCSPQSRALESAVEITRALGLKAPPIIEPELRERDFGIWEGMSFKEIGAAYPVEFKAWANNPLKYSPMEGETTLEVSDRVIPVFERMLKKHEGGHVVAITHGGVSRVALCHYLGLPLEYIFRLEQGFACINLIRFTEMGPRLEMMNHMPWERHS
jgi:alpha-ribazole phosphatase